LTAFDFSCDVSNNLTMINNVVTSKAFKQLKPKIIYYSSCAEYGASDNKNYKYKETAIQNPISKYGATKAIITNHLIKNIEDCSVLRIFNPYSRNLSNRFFLGRLWETINQEKPKREFIISCANDIRDFFNLILLNTTVEKLILRDESVGILNIASGQGITISNLAQTIIQRFAPDKIEIIIDDTTPNSAAPFSIGSTEKLLSLGISIKELKI
jgi:nucleoside-diphosphate-sugar epimerase